jgi:hypothetical protein
VRWGKLIGVEEGGREGTLLGRHSGVGSFTKARAFEFQMRQIGNLFLSAAVSHAFGEVAIIIGGFACLSVSHRLTGILKSIKTGRSAVAEVPKEADSGVEVRAASIA